MQNMIIFGKSLKEYHLLEKLDIADLSFKNGINLVEKYKYDDGSVSINNEQSFYNISKAVWDFSIGGYQPLQKWLKDRKGRVLSEQDIEHYKKMIVAIQKTQEIMAQIDEIIEL